MFDLSTLPISGGLLVAGALWAGVSGFVLAPLVVERSAAKSNWQGQCQAAVAQDIRDAAPLHNLSPELSCDDVLGQLPPGYGDLLSFAGMDAACKALDQAKAQRQRLRELKQARLDRAAEQAGSICSCAVAHLTQSQRWSFALYAGSATLIAPPVAKDLNTALMTSARSPSCNRQLAQEGKS